MDRRVFSKAALASFGLALTGRAHGEPVQGSEPPVPDEEWLDTVLAEIEALNGRIVEGLSSSEPQPDNVDDDPGGIVMKSVILPGSMVASFATPPLSPETVETIRGQSFWKLAEEARPAVGWPDGSRAPDYLPLTGFAAPPSSFAVSGPLLSFLASRNDFPLTSETGIVVFGLRGCRLEGTDTHAEWASEHRLQVASPSHLVASCIVGLWRRSDDAVAVFSASTVPSAHNMFASLVVQGAGTSLLPSGCYRYQRGSHRASKPGRIQRGALLITSKYAVLRTAAELFYDPFKDTTAWTEGAAHNIHAAGMSSIFDSAGCQVVHGNYVSPDRLQARGAWKVFRELAGTADASGSTPSGGQTAFRYMLLTGLEAALAWEGSQAFTDGYRPLRPGSKGPRVKALQERLMEAQPLGPIGRADGDFGINTTWAALIAAKETYNDHATHVVMT